MQIPKQISSPADPDKPSFLKRPAEIRNLVYEQLFKRNGPVLLHDSEVFHHIKPQREYGQDHDEFVHDFHLSLPLLRVCHQIYHEAAGVLYSNNTFVFSRVLNRHDLCFVPNYDDGAYHQITYAPQWLSSIGSQFSMLKKVLIDLDATCEYSCDQRKDSFDILPLLQLLWKHGTTASPITFARTGRMLHVDCALDSEIEDMKIKNPRHADSTVNDLNAIISGMIGKGNFSMRNYAHLDRLITSARLEFHLFGPSIEVLFRGCREPYSKAFSIAESDGELAISTPVPKRDGLVGLPDRVLSKIIGMVVGTPGGITIDMNRRTAHGLNLNVLQLNRLSRSRFRSIVGRDIDLTILDKSTEVTTSLASCDVLQELSEVPPFEAIILPWGNLSAPLTIALNFEIAAPTKMASLRIDIKPLTVLMINRCLGSDTTISITLECYREGRHVYSENRKISLADLERRLFLLLSDAQSDAKFKKLPESRSQLPQILIDGYGKLIGMSYPTAPTASPICIMNRHAELRASEVESRGYQFAERLDGMWSRRSVPIYRLWAQLRNKCWADWETRRPKLSRSSYE